MLSSRRVGSEFFQESLRPHRLGLAPTRSYCATGAFRAPLLAVPSPNQHAGRFVQARSFLNSLGFISFTPTYHAANSQARRAPSTRTCSSHFLRFASLEFFIGPTSVMRTGLMPQN